MKKLFGAVFLTYLFSIGTAQTGIDSLKKLLASSNADTNRVLIFSELTMRYLAADNEMSMNYAQQGLALARALKFRRGEADCIRRSGIVLFQQGRYPEALDHFQTALIISESINDSFGIGAGFFHVGNIYNVQGQYTKARSYYFSALKISEARQDVFEQANIFRDLGKSYLQQGYLDSASIALNRAHELVKNKSDARVIMIWNDLGQLQAESGNEKGAMAFFRKVIASATGRFSFLCDAYLGIADLFHKKGQNDSCIYYAHAALAAGQKNNYSKGVMVASQLLSKAYEGVNEHEAFRYHKMATTLKDSVFNSEKSSQVQNLFFVEQQRLQNLEAARATYKNQLKQYSLLAALVVFLLIALLLYRNNRQKQKAYALLQKQKNETEQQKQKSEQTLDELKSAQAQLVQREKMASLGELTAGIAHEIQNPLNFVNNFSEINKELLVELKDEAVRGNITEVNAIADNLINNEEKINHHGKRADSIVKGMLQHSRSSSAVKEPTDINSLTDEYLRLAYHGLRAKDNSFNATMKTDYDESIGNINIISQDIGRVILNLITNAFYAVIEKKSQQPENYEPIVTVSTKRLGSPLGDGGIEIRVADNGNGIPQKVLDKIFQPFFTTKPTGQGTGLGLSLSYDIIKAHGGEIKVETKEGEGSKFIIQLPTL